MISHRGYAVCRDMVMNGHGYLFLRPWFSSLSLVFLPVFPFQVWGGWITIRSTMDVVRTLSPCIIIMIARGLYCGIYYTFRVVRRRVYPSRAGNGPNTIIRLSLLNRYHLLVFNQALSFLPSFLPSIESRHRVLEFLWRCFQPSSSPHFASSSIRNQVSRYPLLHSPNQTLSTSYTRDNSPGWRKCRLAGRRMQVPM